ncbi:MAG: hypothetical protein M3O32_03705 [Actinomycetota bacterium]|nr:hypothetical protein [Actinomycetota bacterium]
MPTTRRGFLDLLDQALDGQATHVPNHVLHRALALIAGERVEHVEARFDKFNHEGLSGQILVFTSTRVLLLTMTDSRVPKSNERSVAVELAPRTALCKVELLESSDLTWSQGPAFPDHGETLVLTYAGGPSDLQVPFTGMARRHAQTQAFLRLLPYLLIDDLVAAP